MKEKIITQETISQEEPILAPKRSHKKAAVILGAVFIAICAGILLIVFWPNKSTSLFRNITLSATQNNTTDPISSPTPFPFFELTIPYLQNRTFDGTLNAREVSYDNAYYTAYLTSYNSDGLKVNGLLTVPKGNEPVDGWPAIVFVHGYIPPASYNTSQNYYDYVDYLARNGFVVFKIDLRGHGSSEGEAGGAYYSSDYVIDVLNAHNALQKSGFVNPVKIGLWGHSMAGNVISRALAAKKNIPAISIWAGAVYTYEDWGKYGIQDGSYVPPQSNSQRISKRQQLFNTYGEFNKDSAFWKQVPMTNYLTDIQGAVQLNHAVDDNVVNVGYSRDLQKLLSDASVENEIQEYSSGGHNISGSAFNQAMQNTVNFFNKYLKK